METDPHHATTPITKKAPLLTPLLLMFMFAMILANLGGNMYGPLEALYLKQLGAGISQIGLFYTLSQIIPLLLQILGGWLSDSIGRLRAIAIGSVVGIFGYIPLILANRWEWVLLASALNAVTRSLIGPSFDAFIADHSAPENRARLFGVTQTLFAIVSVVGPVLGGYLVEGINFKGMLMVAAGLYILATILRLGMAREAAKGADFKPVPLSLTGLKQNLGAILSLIVAGGLFTWILVTDGVRDIFFNMSFSFLSVFMEEIAGLTIGQIGVMNSVFGIAMMVVMIPAGHLADRVGERVNIAISFVLMAISLGIMVIMFVIYQFLPGWHVIFLPVFILIAFIASFGIGLYITALNVKYRDFRYIIPFIIQFGLYVTPVGFSSSVVPAEYRLLYALNPMVGVIDGFRWCLLGEQMYWPGFWISMAVCVLFLWVGVRHFRKTEKSFADVI